MATKDVVLARDVGEAEMSKLYRAIKTKVTATKDEFHVLTGNTYMPKKETLDRMADAAGISFVSENCGYYVETLDSPYLGYSDLRYVGYAQGEITEPDGKKRRSTKCVYEFNVADWAEEVFIKDSAKDPHAQNWKDRPQYETDSKKKLFILTLKKSAAQRANTGARSRVIRELTGMKTGFKDLFAKNDPPETEKVFTFSKVIVNAENEMVMRAALENMFDNKTAAYGPAQHLLENSQNPEPKNVTPQDDQEPLPEDDFDDFDDQGEEDPTAAYWVTIEQYENSYNLSASAVRRINEYRSNKDQVTVEQLTELCSKLNQWADKHQEARK